MINRHQYPSHSSSARNNYVDCSMLGIYIFIFPVQLTTSRIGNLTRLIHATIAICVTIHTYIDWSMVTCQGSTRLELP